MANRNEPRPAARGIPAEVFPAGPIARAVAALLAAALLASCAARPVAPAAMGNAAAATTTTAPPARTVAPVEAAAPAAPAAAADSPSGTTAPPASADSGAAAASREGALITLRPEVRARYREHLGAAGVTYLLDPVHSDVRIYAFRAGLGARFGHNHVIAVPRFSGYAWAPEKGLQGATADLGFRLHDLQVDPPALRTETGGAFGVILKQADIDGTLEHLLGEQGFQAVSFPWVEVALRVETGEVPVAVADVALSLHGETHHQRVVLKVQADAQRLDASGTLAFRQGDFGVKPYAVMGGLIAVDDLVAIDFHLRGAPAPKGSLE